MFGFLKKHKDTQVVAPVDGTLIPITEVADDVFSGKMMGDGFGAQPSADAIVAPVSGTISSVFPTKHAIGITTAEGLEVLVHLGLDTVELNGEPFTVAVEAGAAVKAGDSLATMDRAKVKESGRDDTVVVVYTNMDLLKTMPTITEQTVTHGQELGALGY